MGVSEVVRRDITDYLLTRGQPFHGRLDKVAFLRRIWDLDSMPSTDSRFKSAGGDIWQHTVNNNDWDDYYLLNTYLELLTCDDATFFAFLEQVVHPIVMREVEEQRKVVSDINNMLSVEGFALRPGTMIGGRPVYRVEAVDVSNHPVPYEVVLSFAGEEREYVERVAAFLKSHGVSVFYDADEEATLWGKDLTAHLQQVYGGSARYCVMFISEHYGEKVWTNYERQNALARAVEKKGEYILPARFDNTELPGIRHTVAYVDLKKKSPEQLGELILQKLGRTI